MTRGGNLGGKTLAVVVRFFRGSELRLFLSMMLWAFVLTARVLPACGRYLIPSVLLRNDTDFITDGRPCPLLGSRYYEIYILF